MNSEFRKPYEYEEEKKGLLIILFIVMILTLDTLQTLSFVSLEYEYLGPIPVLGMGLLFLGGLFILYIIYTAVVVFRMKDNFVVSAKRYIVIRTVFFVSNLLIIFKNNIKNENLVGDVIDQYPTVSQDIIGELVILLLYILFFSVIWYLYFSFSRRLKLKTIQKK